MTALQATSRVSFQLVHDLTAISSFRQKSLGGFGRASLDHVRSVRCGHAARHLRDSASLAAAVTDWQDHPDHEAYAADLERRHRSKHAFWARAGL